MTDSKRGDVRIGDLSAVDASESRVDRVRVKTGGTSAPRNDAGSPARAESPSGSGLKGIPLLVWVLVALFGALAAFALHLYFEQQRLQEAIAALDSSQQQAAARLETKVASTTTTLRSNDAETEKSLNLLADDIRRLDESLGRRGQQVDAARRDLDALVDEFRQSLQQASRSTAQAEARLKALSESQEQLAGRLKSVADSLARLEKSGDVAQMRSELSVLSAALREGQQEHERRLKAAEQAIASNDAFRRQVNATIDRLTQQLAEGAGKR